MRGQRLAIQMVDLNLFPVIQALYITGNTTLAGERLGMSQSAVSNALKRARERFEDPLFVRTRSGMMPTTLATQIIRPIEDGLAQFMEAIDQTRHFDAAASDRLFRLSVNDIGQAVILPRLVEQALREAPRVCFETIELTPVQRQQEISDGGLDLVIGFRPPASGSHFQQLLGRERLVVLLSATSSLASDPMTLEDYIGAQHIDYRASEGSHDALYGALRKLNVLQARRTTVVAAYSDGLASLVANSHLLLTISRRVALTMAGGRNDLRIVDLPPPLSELPPVAIYQQWPSQRHADPAHQWLRRLVACQFQVSKA